MINYYTSSQFKSMDKKAIADGRNEWQLITEAGKRSAELIFKEYRPQTAAVFCGKGNNGRDGLVCAITLASFGVECSLILLGENFDEYQRIIHESKENVKLFGINDIKNLTPCDIIVDAILGIGQNREVLGNIRIAVDYINHQCCTKIALDIPTGVSCDNGSILGSAVKCNKTYTFTAPKPGLYAYPGHEFSGEIKLIDIDISTKNEIPCGHTVTDLSVLKSREKRSHKGTYGRVVCFVGSKEMSGAAYFSAKSAYLCGSGLVEVVTHRENKDILSILLPEAVYTFYSDDSNIEEIASDAIQKADSIIAGCGLGMSETSRRIVRTVTVNSTVPTIYDADALNIIANESLKISCPQNTVLTPHIKEFSRLTGYDIKYLSNNILSCCVEFAKKEGITCLAKDANTIISGRDGTFYINTTGNNGMATGGSGDVLSGIIGSLLAYQAADIPRITATASFIHGKAGDLAQKKLGMRSILASDIMNHIPNVFIE